nr:DKNYY domain-containing protein [uncultured Flavobacterium sp.]
MAEPTGIFIEIETDEKSIKKMLNHKFEKAPYKKKLGYYLCNLLYDCNINPSNVFIFNYNLNTKKCFIAYVQNHFEKTQLEPLIESLQHIALLKNTDTIDYAIISSIFPEVFEAYKITDKEATKTNQKLPLNIVNNLIDKFWSFSKNNNFPEPSKALSKRDYFYKDFKNFYKKYLEYVNEIEKPTKIAQATNDTPYHLFDNFYTYNNRVFEYNIYTKEFIELPESDPVSFRDVAGIKADKNFVYNRILATNSPPELINQEGVFIINPNTIWEWVIVSGIDGDSFENIKQKWDTVYWKDKNSVFIYEKRNLIKIEKADSKTFKHLDFCFGKDKDQMFYLDKVIPIDVNNYTLNKNGFIFDSNTIFHYQNKLQLDAGTFKILEYESEQNPFIGTFIIEDKNGRYKYNKEWEKNIHSI